ncbi:alpha-L-arabinofuranosidase C-terminal domain-containing protein [Streptomyces sp. 900116325]
MALHRDEPFRALRVHRVPEEDRPAGRAHDGRQELPLEVALHGFDLAKIAEHQALADSDPDARNTLTDPDRGTPHQAQDTTLDGAVLRATLEPMSWK